MYETFAASGMAQTNFTSLSVTSYMVPINPLPTKLERMNIT